MDASGLWSFVYSINFQVTQIPATSHHFSCEKSLLLGGSRFLKKKKFSGLRSCYHRQANRKKTYFATEKILQNFEGHDSWHYSYKFFQSGWDVVEIMELDATSKAYSRLKMRSTIERCPLLQKLHKVLFRYKTLR